MAIALTILKIIGIAILAVLALALVLILLILFVPVRYKLTGNMERDNKPYAKAGVSFLLHILSASFVYDNEISYAVRIFGIKIRPKKEKRKGKKEPESDNPISAQDNPPRPSSVEEQDAEELSEPIPEPDDYTIDWNNEPFEEDTQDEAKGKLEEAIDRIVSKYESLRSKYEKNRKKIRFWDKMINDTRNREAFDLIKRNVIRLLKKTAPRKISGFIHFGSDDPATLGKILVFLSIIYPVLPRKFRFEPDFENTDIYGNIKIKGHICLITPVICLARVYFNRDCRRMWRLYKKHTQSS